jgi:hypothetical protein
MGGRQRKRATGILDDLHRERVELLRGLLAGLVLCVVALGAAWLFGHWSPTP